MACTEERWMIHSTFVEAAPPAKAGARTSSSPRCASFGPEMQERAVMPPAKSDVPA